MGDLPSAVAPALRQLGRWARDRFGTRLVKAVLFGSFARGEGSVIDSDVDVLLVVQDITRDEIVEIVTESARVGSTFNLLFSPLVLSESRFNEMAEQDRLLVREVQRDGVAL